MKSPHSIARSGLRMSVLPGFIRFYVGRSGDSHRDRVITEHPPIPATIAEPRGGGKSFQATGIPRPPSLRIAPVLHDHRTRLRRLIRTTERPYAARRPSITRPQIDQQKLVFVPMNVWRKVRDQHFPLTIRQITLEHGILNARADSFVPPRRAPS